MFDIVQQDSIYARVAQSYLESIAAKALGSTKPETESSQGSQANQPPTLSKEQEKRIKITELKLKLQRIQQWFNCANNIYKLQISSLEKELKVRSQGIQRFKQQLSEAGQEVLEISNDLPILSAYIHKNKISKYYNDNNASRNKNKRQFMVSAQMRLPCNQGTIHSRQAALNVNHNSKQRYRVSIGVTNQANTELSTKQKLKLPLRASLKQKQKNNLIKSRDKFGRMHTQRFSYK